MCEADPLVVDDDDPGRRRLHERAFEALLLIRREQDLDGRAGEGGRPEQDVARAEPELRDTPADCVGRGRWDGNRCRRVVGEPPFHEQRRDLLAEQRIPVARDVELPQHWSRKPSAATHDRLEGRRVEWADLDVGQATIRARNLDVHSVPGSKPGHETDLLGLEAAEREFERSP